MLELLWLIPILPLAGAAVNGLLGQRFPKALVTAVGVGAPLLSLLLALGCLWQYAHGSFPGDAYEQVKLRLDQPATSPSRPASCSIRCRR